MVENLTGYCKIDILITIVVMKYSENSKENCLLGCWPTNACK